jgi:hypothetical protein
MLAKTLHGGCAREVPLGSAGSDMPGLAHLRTAATFIRMQANECQSL